MLEYKELKINTDEKMCYINNVAIYLTKNEYNLLNLLLSKPNYVFSREELLNILWKGKKVTFKAVDMTIKRLREKLGKYRWNILSRFGYGYSFNTNV